VFGNVLRLSLPLPIERQSGSGKFLSNNQELQTLTVNVQPHLLDGINERGARLPGRHRQASSPSVPWSELEKDHTCASLIIETKQRKKI
jgi:hypothetical protein